MRYAELDGIRGLAILAVLIHHSLLFEPWTLPDALFVEGAFLGWAGVDLFFALSGFLISGILYDTRQRERYFATFYMRRTLRIFPLYYFYLIVLALGAYVIAPTLPGAQEWRDSQLWAWLYATNFLFAQQESFGNFEVQHLWSLAIEEQFYLIWPLVVWKLGRERLMQLCVALFVATFVLRTALKLDGMHHISIYVLTFTRLDGLLAGAFVAMLIRGPATEQQLKRFAISGAIVGGILLLSAIGISGTTRMHTTPMQTFGFTAVAILAASLILWARTVGVPALRFAPLTTLGRYSYGLYVWHHLVFTAVFALWPIESTKDSGFMLPEMLARAAVSWAAAYVAALISWHVIERHFLELKERFTVDGPRATPEPVNGQVAERGAQP